jgi:phosphohistidine swiveling domain-containing protein
MSSNKNVEILQNIEHKDVNHIGHSLSILAQFAQEKLPVSQGFIITTLGYHAFLDLTDLKKYFDTSKKSEHSHYKSLKKAFDVVDVPENIAANIKKCYARISGFSEAYVNLRALVLDRKAQEVSHRSFSIFDVKGEETIIRAVKTLYRNIIFDNTTISEKFFTGDLQIVVLVQKAQQSEASGVLFTTDILSKDKNKLVIEAVYGLETLVDFEPIVPDQYIYDKEKHTVTEKHITKQEYMIVRQGGNAVPVEKVPISVNWQKRQKLDDKHIVTLARTGLIIEEGIGEPQQVIWSFEAGKIWINFIESSQKMSLKSGTKSTLQELVDEQVVLMDEQQKGALDVNLHIPKDIIDSKNVSLDVVIEEKVIEKVGSNLQIEKKHKVANMKTQSKTKKLKINEEPLLEGRHYSGKKAEGDVCFDPMQCRPSDILVLKGDENLAADIKVAGFIIEDESDILAEKLHEYFSVPVITGVPLARKILKPGEKISVDGGRGHIYETLPYSEQVGEIEMNFMAHKNLDTEVTNISIPVPQDNSIQINTSIPSAENVKVKKIEKDEETKKLDEDLSATVSELLSSHNDTDDEEEGTRHITIDTESTITSILSHEEPKRDEPLTVLQTLNLDEDKDDEQYDISRLLDLVENDEPELIDLKTEITVPEIKGVEEADVFNLWGKSLEKVIDASKSISPVVATEALEHVIEDTNILLENSKEIEFDTEEEYIGIQLHKEEEKKDFACSFIPTATKVYVTLIDEKLPEAFKNFDGIIFSSSFDKDIYLEMLEDTLIKSENKEVLAITPPYEKEAFEDFLQKVHVLRNKGYRNLSLILPDYRNKNEISEMKKTLSSLGLKRSSTFTVFANLSRTINVFRLKELSKTVVDGVYVDLFRLKMNMLGVEKLTASTNYADGMKSMVAFVHENLHSDSKSIVNISGFNNASTALDHILTFGFWAVSCSLSNTDKIKKKISGIEKKSILEDRPHSRKINLKRR